MILFDPEQSEAVEGFPGLKAAGDSRSVLPTRPTLMRYLREAQGAVRLKGEVTVLLTTDAGIRRLNRRFRGKNKATDVLSFPAEAGFGIAGDLAISVETAARQAAEQGHALRVELRVLMLHGLLHLAGMDHEVDKGEMAKKEGRLRAKLGLPLGLIERVEGRGQGTENSRQRTAGREQRTGNRDQVERRGFPSGRTDRKARTVARAGAKTRATAEADSPKGNDRKKGKGDSNTNDNDKGKGNSNTDGKGNSKGDSKGNSTGKATAAAKVTAGAKLKRGGR